MKEKNNIIFCEKKEIIWIFVKGLGILAFIGILFYDSLVAVLLGSPLLFFYCKGELMKLKMKKSEKLEDHFKEALSAVVAALRAGYSVENAFVEAYKDLAYRFGKKDAMVSELLLINRQVKNNTPMEQLLEKFAQNTGSSDIKDFAEIFKIAKRSGGDMGEIMEHTISIITRRIEIKEETRMLTAAKKYEQKIMNLVPMGIIFYIRMTNPGYFNSLYHNAAGVAVMTAALVVYAAAYYMSEKILAIAC